MRNNTFHHLLYSSLCTLVLLGSCTCLPSVQAQERTLPTKVMQAKVDRKTGKMDLLKQKIDLAVEDRKPREAIRFCEDLMDQARRQKHLAYLLYASALHSQLGEELDPEERKNSIARIWEIRTLPWLSEADQMVLHAYMLDYYTQRFRPFSWSPKTQSPETDRAAQLGESPDFWGMDQFRSVLLRCMDGMLKDPKLLSDTTIDLYYPIFKTDCSSPEKSEVIDLSRSLLFQFISLCEKLMQNTPFLQTDQIEVDGKVVDLYVYLTSQLDGVAQATSNKELADYIVWKRLQLDRNTHRISQEEYATKLRSLIDRANGQYVLSNLYEDLCRQYDYGRRKYRQRRAELIELCEQLLMRCPEDTFSRRELLRNLYLIVEPSFNWQLPAVVQSQDTVWLQVDRFEAYDMQSISVKIDRMQDQQGGWRTNTPETPIEGQTLELHLTPKDLMSFTDETGDSSDTFFRYPIAAKLPYGTYRVQLKVEPLLLTKEFSPFEGVESVLYFGVSDLLTVKLTNSGSSEIRVHEANSGRAVPLAEVEIFTLERKYGENRHTDYLELKMRLKTDKSGIVVLPSELQGSLHCRPISGEDRYCPSSNLYVRGGYQEKDDSIAAKPIPYVYTDRSVYRPGQRVFFSGILYESNVYRAKSKVLSGRKVEVALYDANMEFVDSLSLTSGEYGEYDGSFLLSERTLGGAFFIKAKYEEEESQALLYVEEYKRPRFELTLKKEEKRQYKLGEKALIEGQAKLYSGVGLPGAQVRAVTTVVRYDSFYRSMLYRSASSEIVSVDTTETDSLGNFQIALLIRLNAKLERERQSLEKEAIRNSYYHFRTTVTVLSENGETQSVEHSFLIGKPHSQLSVHLRSTGITYGVDDSRLFIDKSRSGEKLYFELDAPFDSAQSAKVSFSLSGKDGRVRYHKDDLPLVSIIDIAKEWGKLPSGSYVLKAFAYTDSGDRVELSRPIVLYGSRDKQISEASKLFVRLSKEEYSDGNPPELLLASKFEDAQVYYDVITRKGIIERRHICLSSNRLFRLRPNLPSGKLPPAYMIRIYTVRNAELYEHRVHFKLKEPDKTIRIKQISFRDRSLAGSAQQWSFSLTDASGKPLKAHVTAFLTDEALQAIRPREWIGIEAQHPFLMDELPASVSRREMAHCAISFSQKRIATLPHCVYRPNWHSHLVNVYRGPWYARGGVSYAKGSDSTRPTLFAQSLSPVADVEESVQENLGTIEQNPAVRQNFAETAFFYPQLTSDEHGEVSWRFTLPESLTRWELQLVAHTPDLFWGNRVLHVESYKELMLVPNMPRFLRRGDQTVVAATVYNRTDIPQQVEYCMELFDPDSQAILQRQTQPLKLEPGAHTTASFELQTVGDLPLIGVRLMAIGETHTDGEQYILPQLSDVEKVRVTLPLSLSPGEEQVVDLFTLLPQYEVSDLQISLQNEGGLLWPLFRSLISVVKPKENNAIEIASFLYANRVVEWLLSRPSLQPILKDIRQSSPDVSSTLRHSGEAYDMLDREMPWLRESKLEEASASALLALLNNDSSRLPASVAIEQLRELQRDNGGFAWYSDMEASFHVTSYIVELFTRLKIIGISERRAPELDICMLAFNYLDAYALREVNRLLLQKISPKRLPYNLLRYLYLSTIADRRPETEQTKKVWDYCLPLLYHSMSKLPLEELPYAAIIAQENNQAQKAAWAVEVLRQHLTDLPHQGTFFAMKESESYHWQDNRYPLHLAAMEAINRVEADWSTIHRMQKWLLSQRRVQYWPSSPTTVNIIQGLLMNEQELLGQVSAPSRQMLTIPSDGQLRVRNESGQIQWYGVYIDYSRSLEQASELLSVAKGPLQLESKAYKVVVNGNQKRLQALEDGEELHPGDEVRLHYTIRLDRDMDFIVLSDSRIAAAEPMGPLSGYKYEGGTFFYFEAKDSGQNFFFDTLHRGSYQLSFSQRIQHEGFYRSGKATLRSAYAPAFSCELPGLRVRVRKE